MSPWLVSHTWAQKVTSYHASYGLLPWAGLLRCSINTNFTLGNWRPKTTNFDLFPSSQPLLKCLQRQQKDKFMRIKSTPWKDLCGVNETRLTIQTFNLHTSACVFSKSHVDSSYKVAQEENKPPRTARAFHVDTFGDLRIIWASLVAEW